MIIELDAIYQHTDMSWLYLRVNRIHEDGILDLAVVNPTNNPNVEWAETVNVSFPESYIFENYKLYERGNTLPDWEV